MPRRGFREDKTQLLKIKIKIEDVLIVFCNSAEPDINPPCYNNNFINELGQPRLAHRSKQVPNPLYRQY